MTKGVRTNNLNPPRQPGPPPARAAGRRVTARGAASVRRAVVCGLGALSLAAAAAVSSVGCARQDDMTFDPRRIQQDERLHNTIPVRPNLDRVPTTLEATPRVPRGATALPTTLPTTGASITGMEVVRLPLREIMQRAVANSGEVRVAGFEPAINESRVIEAEARFDPRAFANVQFQRTDEQTLGSINSFGPADQRVVNAQRSDQTTIEAGIRQLLPSGGEARFSFQTQNTYSNPRQFQNANAFWSNQLQVEITQPLLQNFGGDINAARIRIARNDQRISVLDFRRVLEDNLFEIERDYWQLFEAAAQVQIEEDLLLGTIQTYSTLYDRWLRGVDASLIPVRQAESAVHQRKALLIVAKQRVRDLSADIKRRMNDPQFPVSGSAVILPLNPPVTDPINFETKEQIDTALENRHELGQQLIRINSAEIAQQVARNNELPRLDLLLRLGFGGVDANLSTAFREQGEFNHFNATVGLQFEYPIGNREARAIVRRAMLQRYQAIEQYRNITGQVALDVIQALNEIDSSWQQIGARHQARLASADQLRLLQEQEDVGGRPLTPEFVNVKLQAQSDLAESRRQEASAIAAYNNAIQRLQRAKGTLLRYNNILIDEDEGGVMQGQQARR